MFDLNFYRKLFKRIDDFNTIRRIHSMSREQHRLRVKEANLIEWEVLQSGMEFNERYMTMYVKQWCEYFDFTIGKVYGSYIDRDLLWLKYTEYLKKNGEMIEN